MSLSLLPRAISLVVAAGILTACTPQPEQEQLADVSTTSASPDGSASESVDASAVPVDTVPHVERGTNEACPYLDTQFVTDTNGQRMTDQGVDHSFDTPACAFYSYPEEPQAVVMVRHMGSFDEVMQVVDFAAPIDSTSPAEFSTDTGDWSGGRGPVTASPTGAGSVYAVGKDSTAVVVWSNQEQSVKAETLAHQVIANLGL